MSARTVVQEMGGTLDWDRCNDRTVFEVVIPLLVSEDARPQDGSTSSESELEPDATVVGDMG